MNSNFVRTEKLAVFRRLGSCLLLLSLSAGCNVPARPTATVDEASRDDGGVIARQPSSDEPPNQPSANKRPLIPRPTPEFPALAQEPPPFQIPTDDPAFAEQPEQWWKRRSPCPDDGRVNTWKGSVSLQGGEVIVGYQCKRGDMWHGPWVSFYTDGTRAEDGWKREGRHHGFRREWYPDGKLAVKLSFIDGRRHGAALFLFRDGSVWRKGTFRDDERFGRWLSGGDSGFRDESYYGIAGPSVAMGWWPDGNVAYRAKLRGSSLEGDQVIWDTDGTVVGHSIFHDGAGRWTFWEYEGDRRSASVTCLNGRVTEAAYWNREGAHIVTYRQPDHTKMRSESLGPAGKVLTDQRESLPHPTNAICNHPSFPNWVISGPARGHLLGSR